MQQSQRQTEQTWLYRVSLQFTTLLHQAESLIAMQELLPEPQAHQGSVLGVKVSPSARLRCH